MMISICSAIALILSLTAGLNIRENKLAAVPTVFQLLALVVSCLGIPVAVFGLILLQARKA